MYFFSSGFQVFRLFWKRLRDFFRATCELSSSKMKTPMTLSRAPCWWGRQGIPDLARGSYECQRFHGFDHLGSLSRMPLLCTYSLEIHFYMQSGKFMQSGSKNRHKIVPIRGEQKALENWNGGGSAFSNGNNKTNNHKQLHWEVKG